MTNSQSPETEAQILDVSPAAAIPGGELRIRGRNLSSDSKASVRIGEVNAPVIVGSRQLVIARVPDGAQSGEVIVGGSEPATFDVGIQIADGLHPVASPAVDSRGNVYATMSGTRGQKTPVSVFRVDPSGTSRPFLTDIMNATGLALDRDGMLYVASRHDGIVYQATPDGEVSVFVEGMGIATGLAFDADGNLYVGDRSGTIFKISPQRQIYVFTTLEASIAAYHLAFGNDGYLYITGPTTSSFDPVIRVSSAGQLETYYRGLGRPQGLAFDAEGNLYVAGSLAGRRGIVRIGTDREAELFLSGPGIVGLAFAPDQSMVVATNGALYRVPVHVAGRPLP